MHCPECNETLTKAEAADFEACPVGTTFECPACGAELYRTNPQLQSWVNTQAWSVGCLTFVLGGIVIAAFAASLEGPRKPVFSESTLDRRARDAHEKLQREGFGELDDADIADLAKQQEYSDAHPMYGWVCCGGALEVLVLSYIAYGAAANYFIKHPPDNLR